MVAVLLIEGDQLPVIPFVEVVGRGGIDVPMQYGPTGPNTGMPEELTVSVALAENALTQPVRMVC